MDARRTSSDAGRAPLVFDFEFNEPQGWRFVPDSRDVGHPKPEWSNFRTFSGSGALKVPVPRMEKDAKLFVGIEGNTEEIGLRETVSRITFHLWLPSDHTVTFVQAFMFGFDAPLKWQGINHFQAGGLRAGEWTTLKLTFPNGYEVVPGWTALGIEIQASATSDWVAFIDDVVVEFVAR